MKFSTGTRQPHEVVTLEGAPPLDVEHEQWVASVRWTLDIKPGMTRKDLLRVYTVEGGLSTRTQQTYALKGCPGIQVDVEFAPVGNLPDGLTKSPKDQILKISKPYFDYSHMDQMFCYSSLPDKPRENSIEEIGTDPNSWDRIIGN